jgi:hypothetical protein
MISASAGIRGFPLGLALLAKTMYLAPRPVLKGVRGGYIISFYKLRGWLMGDPMTKLLLTTADLYALRVSDVRVASLVGDDVVALSPFRRHLQSYLDCIRSVDFLVSEDDTYVSDRILYFCEEVARVPRKVSESLVVTYRREHLSLPYIDYPRIRLLVPVRPDMERESYTHLGRFSLLGKQSKWSQGLNPACAMGIMAAQMFQHLTIPQPAEVMFPCLPVEIGGDGSYPPGPSYLRAALDRADLVSPGRRNEAIFRIRQLLSHSRHNRYVLSRRATNLTPHRFAVLAPLYEEMKRFFPEGSLITGNNQYHRNLLSCIPRVFADPLTQFLRIGKSLYYREILRGRSPEEISLKLNLGREFPLGRTHQPDLTDQEVGDFLQQWKNPGFSFRNELPYLVDSDRVTPFDYLSLGWDFTPGINLRDPEFSYLRENLNTFEAHEDLVLDLLRSGRTDFPSAVMDRLPAFLESDNLLLWQAEELKLEPDSILCIVTKDMRLAEEFRKKLRLPTVWTIDPSLWLIGRGYEITHWTLHFVQDPGAILYSDVTEWENGIHSSGEAIFTAPLVKRLVRGTQIQRITVGEVGVYSYLDGEVVNA